MSEHRAQKLLRRISDQIENMSPEDTIGYSNGSFWIDLASVEEIRSAAYQDSVPSSEAGLLEALENLANLDQRCGWHSKELDAALSVITRYDGGHLLPSASQTLVNLATAVLAHAPAEASEFMGIGLDDIRAALSLSTPTSQP